MRVIFLQKGLVDDTAPLVEAEGGNIELYHGTILPALYKILESRKFGSEAGRHKYAWERLGNFYVTLAEGIAKEYAWEAACDPYYFQDAGKFLRVSLSEEDISIDRLMRKFNAKDLYDLYIKIASYVRYHGIVDEEDIYPQVIIKLTVRSPSVLAELRFDEDDFRNWLMDEKVSKIIDVAKRDPEFSGWLSSEPVILEAVTTGADKTFKEAFRKFDNPAEVYLDLGNAVLQETAKEIYLALVRLAKGGDKEAAGILRQAAPFISSYAFYRRLPLKTPIKLVIRQPEVLDRVYFDEDLTKFFEWVRKICPRCKFPLTPNRLAWELASPSYEEPDYYEEDDEYYDDEKEEGDKPTSEEEELPPVTSYFPEEFHEVAKRIYRALIRLADEGWNRDVARRILEEFKKEWETKKADAETKGERAAWSYFVQSYTPLESIDEATATVYLDTGPKEINLKDGGALQQVEGIMRDQILDWVSILR
jgi:hypothetical protein